MKDQIFAEPQDQVLDFRFDEQVAEVFQDMAKRSIPGYQTIIQTIGNITAKYTQNDSNLYDLGCSLGAATITMRKNLSPAQNCQIIAIDNSEAMITRCRNILNSYRSEIPVTTLCQDLNDSTIKNASIVILNFVLQFIDPHKRDQLIQKIYDGMKPEGILLISEKIAFADQEKDDQLMELYWDFKRNNGYSELEISQKRNALENVLIRDQEEQHLERLNKVGFKKAFKWFQCYNFASFLAIK